MRVNYAIVFVSDMRRAVLFYRDVIGLPLKFESPGWTEFKTDGATLALHSAEGSTSETDNPQTVTAGRCRPGLSVQNLDEFHKKMVERHIRCAQEPRETFGTRIAQYVDPDGLVISVAEEVRGPLNKLFRQIQQIAAGGIRASRIPLREGRTETVPGNRSRSSKRSRP